MLGQLLAAAAAVAAVEPAEVALTVVRAARAHGRQQHEEEDTEAHTMQEFMDGGTREWSAAAPSAVRDVVNFDRAEAFVLRLCERRQCPAVGPAAAAAALPPVDALLRMPFDPPPSGGDAVLTWLPALRGMPGVERAWRNIWAHGDAEILRRGLTRLRAGAEAARAPRAPPVEVVYHWTPERNFGAIEDAGLRVARADAGQVRNGQRYGEGVYTATQFRCDENRHGGYGEGAARCFLCLAAPGVAGPDGSCGYLARGRMRVLRHTDQLLPLFLVDDGSWRGAQAAAEGIVASLCGLLGLQLAA